MGKFKLGKMVTTKGVYEVMASSVEFRKFVANCLARHLRGDWGDVVGIDRQENELALKDGFRLMSVYKFMDAKGEKKAWKVWVITEADRSVTTVLFPSEY